MKDCVVKIFFAAFFFSCLGGCARPEAYPNFKKSSDATMAMGTVVRVDVCYYPSQEAELRGLYQQIWQRISEIENKISAFQETSEVSAINRSYQHPVVVSQETRHLLELSVRYAQLTRGAFDITVGPLVELWREAGTTGQLPTVEQVNEPKHGIGLRTIRFLPDGKVELNNPVSRIDLAAVADGYAADEVARLLRARGFERFFVDVGGDIYAGGFNCSGKPWQVGIRHPFHENEIIEQIAVVNAGVATSGDYTQRKKIGGQEWSHIINPLTGYPEKIVTSATVISPTATEADALATALCVLPVGEGLTLIDSLGPQRAAYALTQDQRGRIHRYQSQIFERRVFINLPNAE